MCLWSVMEFGNNVTCVYGVLHKRLATVLHVLIVCYIDSVLQASKMAIFEDMIVLVQLCYIECYRCLKLCN